jgi:hypothetical protein
MAQNFASRRLADSFSLTFFLVLICFTSFRLCVPGDGSFFHYPPLHQDSQSVFGGLSERVRLRGISAYG